MSRLLRLKNVHQVRKKSIYKKLGIGIFLPVFSVLSFFIYNAVFADVSQLGPEEFTNGSHTTETQPKLEFYLSGDEELVSPVRYRIELCTNNTGDSTCLDSRILSYESAQDIELTEEEPELYEFTVGQQEGGGEYVVGSENQELEDGTYWWRVQTIDDEGETSEFLWASEENSPSFIVDTTPPSVNSNAINPNPTNNTTVQLTGTATDLLDVVASVEFQVDSLSPLGTWSECSANDSSFNESEEPFTCTVDLEEFGDGEHTIYVRATDQGGNISTPSSGQDVVIDTEDLVLVEDSVLTELADDSVTITWDTNKEASSIVKYGLSNTLDLETDEYNTAPRVDSHSVVIDDLLPCTTYYYQVLSIDQVNQEVESDVDFFITDGCVGEASVVSQTSASVSNDSNETVDLLNDDDNGIVLDIPEGFHGDDGNFVFQIKELSNEEALTVSGKPGDSYNLISGYLYDLKAFLDHNQLSTFDKPIVITINFDQEEVEGINLATLGLFRWDGDEWVALDCESVNNNSITCTTSNFSLFGLFGEGNVPTITGPSNNSAPSFSSVPPSCTEASPVGAPNLFQIDVSDTQARLYFAPLGAPNNKYAIVYGYEPGEERFGILFDYGPTTGVLSYTINDLDPNSTYYFKMRGQNGCMPGAWGNEMKITTKVKGSTTGTTFYKDFLSRILSIFPKDATEISN